jgi:hypothetical protein
MGITMINKIWNFLELLATAKAAGILARQGRKQEAINLMNSTKAI